MNINTSILKSLSFPVSYLQEKQQLKTTLFYIFSILIVIMSVIMLLGFQIFYIF